MQKPHAIGLGVLNVTLQPRRQKALQVFTAGTAPVREVTIEDRYEVTLNSTFETDVPGLFATSILATPSFGPFFGFTLSARTAATVLAHGVATRLAQSG